MTRGMLPVLAVKTTPESSPHWKALTRGEFVVAWCGACDWHVWPIRAYCTTCMAPVESLRMLTGIGTIYSRSIVHRAAPGFEGAVPYVLAYVALDGGPTVLANILTDNPEHVEVHARVRIVAQGDGVVGAARFLLASD